MALHPPISPLTSSGQPNRASWASQPEKSVTLLPCPGGKTTKSVKDMWKKKKILHVKCSEMKRYAKLPVLPVLTLKASVFCPPNVVLGSICILE